MTRVAATFASRRATYTVEIHATSVLGCGTPPAHRFGMRHATRLLVLLAAAAPAVANANPRLKTGYDVSGKAPSIAKTRKAIRSAAGEPWVDPWMRKAMGIADDRIGAAVQELGGLKAAKGQILRFLMLSTVKTFANGAHLTATLDDNDKTDGGKTIRRTVELENGDMAVSVAAGTYRRKDQRALKDIALSLTANGRTLEIDRLYLPATAHQGAQVVSSRTVKTREHGGGDFRPSALDASERDAGRALAARLDLVRGYADAASRTGKRELRGFLRGIDELVASPRAELTYGGNPDLGGSSVTVKVPGRGQLIAYAGGVADAITFDLKEGEVTRHLYLDLVGTQGGILRTRRPKRYAAGFGEEEREVHLGGPSRLGRSVDRSRKLTRPLAAD